MKDYVYSVVGRFNVLWNPFKKSMQVKLDGFPSFSHGTSRGKSQNARNSDIEDVSQTRARLVYLGYVFNYLFSQTRNPGALLKPQELITTCGRYLPKYKQVYQVDDAKEQHQSTNFLRYMRQKKTGQNVPITNVQETKKGEKEENKIKVCLLYIPEVWKRAPEKWLLEDDPFHF